MKFTTWLGNFAGSTLRQSAFYEELFTILEKDGKVYLSELEGWSSRTMRQWCHRLKNLEIIQLKKEGWGGSYYYKWHPKLLGIINEWWAIVKKGI